VLSRLSFAVAIIALAIATGCADEADERQPEHEQATTSEAGDEAAELPTGVESVERPDGDGVSIVGVENMPMSVGGIRIIVLGTGGDTASFLVDVPDDGVELSAVPTGSVLTYAGTTFELVSVSDSSATFTVWAP